MEKNENGPIYSSLEAKAVCWCCGAPGEYLGNWPTADCQDSGTSGIPYQDYCASIGGTTSVGVDMPC